MQAYCGTLGYVWVTIRKEGVRQYFPVRQLWLLDGEPYSSSNPYRSWQPTGLLRLFTTYWVLNSTKRGDNRHFLYPSLDSYKVFHYTSTLNYTLFLFQINISSLLSVSHDIVPSSLSFLYKGPSVSSSLPQGLCPFSMLAFLIPKA